MSGKDVPTNRDPVALEAWEKDIELEIARVGQLMEPLQKRLEAAREKLDLVRRLRHLVAGAIKPNSRTTAAVSGEPPPAGLGDVEQKLYSILETSGQPMHIGAIREQLIARGVHYPDAVTKPTSSCGCAERQNSFSARAAECTGLTSWNLPAAPAVATRRFRRRRRATA